MALLTPSSLLHRLRRSQVLRVLFTLMGLFWMVSATACALHDLSPDCEYTVNVTDSHDHHDDVQPNHVPCCPHPLSIQLPMFEVEALPKASVATAIVPVALVSQPFSSHLQSPPTPPPIAG